MPFRSEDDVTLTDVVRVAGMGTAIGLGVRKWWQLTDFNQIVQSHRIPSNYGRAFSATRNALDKFGESAPLSSRFNQIGFDNLISAIESEKLYVTPADIRSTILRSAQKHDPSGNLVQRLQSQMEEGASSIQILRELQETGRSANSSIYIQRTIASFLDDIEDMEGRLMSGKGLVPYALPNMRLSDVGNITLKELSARNAGLAQALEEIGTKLQGKMFIKSIGRKGAAEAHQLSVEIFASPFLPRVKKGSQLSLTIPLSSSIEPGMVTHGATGQSRYIAGEFWLVDKLKDEWRLKKRMRYEEWAARRFLEKEVYDIMQAQRLSRREVHAMETLYHQEIHKPLEWVDTLPTGLHRGQDEYIRMRQQAARLFALGRDLTDLEYGDIVQRGLIDEEATDLFARQLKVYPAASPTQMTRNLVSTQDWRAMSLFPEAFDWARRPMQAIRREYTPTPQAVGRIERNRLSQMYQWAARTEGAPAAMIRTMYVKPSMAPELAELGMNIEGGGLLSRTKLPLFAQEELARYEVASQDLLDLKHIIGTAPEWEGSKLIPAGTTLGRDVEGNLLTTDEPFTLLTATRYQDANKKDFVRLVGTRRLEDMRWFKVFGDAKAMMGVVPSAHIGRVAQLVTGSDTPHHLPIHAIVTMDELKKNRALHYKQMFTSLHEFTRQNMSRGRLLPSEFLTDPGAVVSRIRRLSTRGDKIQHDVVLRELMQLSRAGQLTPEQMGGVFGAVPEVFGEGWSSPLARAGIKLTSEEHLAIARGTPIGLAQMSFGGRYGPGSGKMGSIEPRMFELLTSPHFGTLGPELQEEVMKRMLYRYPQRPGEQKILAQTAESLLSPSGKAGVLPSQWTGELTQKGGLLNIPGIGDVNIPAAAEMSQLASYKTSSGVVVTPDLSKQLGFLIEDARRFEAGVIDKKEMEKSMGAARKAVQKYQMLTVTGEEGLLRGRLPGSRFLTSVPMAHTYELGLAADEVGVTMKYAKQMARELEAVHGEKGLAKSIISQLRAGESVGAMAMRHPFIGPYSTAAVKMRLIAGDEPIAVFGEQFAKARLADTGEVLGNMRISSAIGMAMDYDADIVSLMMLPRGMSEKAAGMAMSPEYESYAIRSQLLKAKKAATKSITLSEAAKGAALKLRIPKERLGLISESLQVARAAALSGSQRLGTERTMNALGLLEWLEQTPISGKHIAAGEEERMITLFSNIRRAISSRESETLLQNVQAVIGQKGPGSRFMREGGRVILEQAGKRRGVDVKGIGLSQAVEDIMSTLGTFEKQTPEGWSAARWRQVVRGKGKPISRAEAKAMPGFLRSFGPELSPFAGLVETMEKTGAMSSVSRRMSSLRNKTASFGGRLLEHAKPLALGFGAAVGIATLLSSPPKSMKMDLPRSHQMPGGGRGGSNLSPEEIASPEAHRQQMGSPTVENAMSGTNSTPVMPNSVAVSVRGKSRGNVDFNMLNSQLSRSLGNAQITSRVLDNRRSLTSQNLAKILEENE